MDLYRRLADAVEQGRTAALATLIRAEGATPRKVGTKMIVYENGQIEATIGGGEVEALVIRGAVEAIQQGTSRLLHYELKDKDEGDPGICGGAVEVFVDVVQPRPVLLVVGAGHVAMPLAEMGYQCGFRVVAVDDRPDMLSEERFPHADERLVGGVVETLQSLPVTPVHHIVIVTRGHAHDEDALRVVIDAPAAYLGMIGSRRKVKTVFDHLRADGVDEGLIRRVHAPIGLDIGAQTPAEISISILAEIITLRRGGRGPYLKLEP
jgi:xanthine dehydrogenase accessory factor